MVKLSPAAVTSPIAGDNSGRRIRAACKDRTTNTEWNLARTGKHEGEQFKVKLAPPETVMPAEE